MRKTVPFFLLFVILLSLVACGGSSNAYRGIKYGMTRDQVAKMEEGQGSYDATGGFYLSDSLHYFFDISGKYADIAYDFEKCTEAGSSYGQMRLVYMHIFSRRPYLWAELPQFINVNYLSPDELYSVLTEELTKKYGKPTIKGDTVIWENDFETIEGSIETRIDRSDDNLEIVDENGNRVDSVSYRMASFAFYLKEK